MLWLAWYLLQMKVLLFHGGDTGSIPVQDANFLGNLKFSGVRKPVYFTNSVKPKFRLSGKFFVGSHLKTAST
jgi:hypothetical protein